MILNGQDESSRACKGKQQLKIVIVGSMQSVDVSAPYVAQRLQVGRAPGEPTAALLNDQQVGCKPRPAAIAIRKGMHQDDSMVKTHRHFVSPVVFSIQ